MRLRPAVIEGDLASQIDAERIEQLGVPVVQINTDGMCHLDATMIAAAAAGFDLRSVDLLVIENVGNLVCTASYDLGEHLRVGGAERAARGRQDCQVPGHLPAFRRADHHARPTLLPHFDFDVDRVTSDMQRLAPALPVFQVSAKTGDGIDDLADWIVERARARRKSSV